MEEATKLRVPQRVISRLQQRYRQTGRVTGRHRGGRPLATSRFIVNSALWNQMITPLKESALHQPVLYPDGPLVVVLQCGQLSDQPSLEEAIRIASRIQQGETPGLDD
ncbi:hypothetical protein ATANTOWER_025543 [Ataeniobius toweri]|uniref:Helix-turn-helix domain-containing protein n=1 Tax=Ataeniobius toweri TaxID=208326 RepID=A0ABU7ATB3_9TELE|nr:hypothetical protein [Ataeniobius toweri]